MTHDPMDTDDKDDALDFDKKDEASGDVAEALKRQEEGTSNFSNGDTRRT